MNISKQDTLKLAQIVREETGNHVQERNFPMLESRIRSRIFKLGLKSMEDYWLHFNANETRERAAIQSLMTTHYTFFFREFVHFELLESWIENSIELIKKRYKENGQPLKVWSAACSRGQEVYSLAMFLSVKLQKKHGVPYKILGTDLDAESVEVAKKGVYPLKEVMTIPREYLPIHWKKDKDGSGETASATQDILDHVEFKSANLLEPQSWGLDSKFDVIFCRNVFIYFSEDNVKKIAQSLMNQLSDNGIFISGVSEPMRFSGWAWPALGPSCYIKSVNPPKEVAAPQASATELKKKLKVLCVDDSQTIHLLMKKIFAQDSKWDSIDSAFNGREAREKLDKKKYDLVTLDIHMPEVSGIEFLERLYKKDQDPPVLVVSSVNRMDTELAVKAVSLGALDYVEKPAMNKLQICADEILNKANSAVKGKSKVETKVITEFITNKTNVVPDASQCVRVVFVDSIEAESTKHVVLGQKNEYRSPSLVLVLKGDKVPHSAQTQISEWSNRKITICEAEQGAIKPNQIYLCTAGSYQFILPQLAQKTVSLQILSFQESEIRKSAAARKIQVLIDEALSAKTSEVERELGRKVDDVTPSTSFASLSFEYFSNIKKVA